MFPKYIIDIIFDFDRTYHDHYKEKILPLIKKNWVVMAICNYTGRAELLGYQQKLLFSKTNIDYNSLNNYYNYNDCLNFCKKLSDRNYTYKTYQIIIKNY